MIVGSSRLKPKPSWKIRPSASTNGHDDVAASELQKRISSYEIHRGSGVTQKTAWFMLQRIRLAMQAESHGGKLHGEVEWMKPTSAEHPASCTKTGARAPLRRLAIKKWCSESLGAAVAFAGCTFHRPRRLNYSVASAITLKPFPQA